MRTLLLVALVGAASAFVEVNEWAAFKAKHGKSYSNPIEEVHRMKVYADNKAFVEMHQKEFAAGLHTYQVELNKFADLTVEEWSRMFKGQKPAPKKQNPLHQKTGRALAATVDWRDEGYVTPIKDQGQCGSCWAFSTTGSLEGAYVKAGNPLTSFSEQQLVDCSKREGNDGCKGGLMDFGFDYIEMEGGIEKEEDYPYHARTSRCKADKSMDVKMEISYKDIPSEDESALADAVNSVGPISVAIDASHTSFQLYSSGVYNERRCSSTRLDHGVLAVGYGEEAGTPYWLVKNSWGRNWGMDGYIMMSKDHNNQCGVATQASYPTVM